MTHCNPQSYEGTTMKITSKLKVYYTNNIMSNRDGRIIKHEGI